MGVQGSEQGLVAQWLWEVLLFCLDFVCFIRVLAGSEGAGVCVVTCMEAEGQ